ncbi:anosmin-1b [Engraulis encrasicolus]|uniref:anosmin-1b n=1 Tax=Engraulis encrasicolus TaxID=184585 RepID=UPI002FD3DFE3
MSFWQLAIVLVWYLTGFAIGRRAGAEDGDILSKTNSARCTSRCLTLHMTQLTASFKHLQSDGVLGWCESHRRCAQCLQPCKELWETGRGLSEKSCEHHECVTSGEYVLSLQSQKQGDCPSPQRASGFAAACVESCGTDKECSGTKKCCSNGCGHTCQTPASLFKGVPLKPKKDMSFSEDLLGHLEVKWTSKFNVSIEPVLYILQRRWNYGIHPSEDEASSWQTILMTIEERAVLKDVRPHRWYQFRVSAVNSQGTRGFTTPSKHFFSSRDPFPPEAPQNLRRGNVTVRPDGLVSVTLLWDTPAEGDLPIHHYRVSWSARGVARPAQSRRENARVTDGAATEFELHGLQPNLVHQVQVQAIAYWGQKRLKSPRAQLSFTTTSTASSAAPGQGHFTGEFSNELPLSPHSSSSSSSTTPSVVRLEAAAPHYHDNQLQVKVFWKSQHPEEAQKDSTSYLLRWYPEVCTNNVTKRERKATVQGTHFVITGLLFACKYRVGVMPLTGAPGSEAVTSVTTPQCSALKGRGKKFIPCARDGEHHPVVRKAQLRPEKLGVDFQAVNGSLQAVFSWQVSQAAPGQAPITGFQLSWVQVPSSSSGGISDEEIAVTTTTDTIVTQTRILPPDQFSYSVDGLLPGSVYKVQVQVLSAGGSGPSVARTLHSPQLPSTDGQL